MDESKTYGRLAAEEMVRQMEEVAKERMPDLLKEPHGLFRAFMTIFQDDELRQEAVRRTQAVLKGQGIGMTTVGLVPTVGGSGEVTCPVVANAARMEVPYG